MVIFKSDIPRLLKAYWQWFADNDVNATSTKEGVGNGGLFTLLKLNHIDASDNVVLAIQYTGPNGQVGARMIFLSMTLSKNECRGWHDTDDI